jgi:5'-nucleotidase / UDP-sugar diphosphatase
VKARIRFVFLNLVLCASVLASSVLIARSAVAEPLELVILHVNDWDRLEPVDGAGGAAKIVSAIRRERADAIADGAETLTTFGGDMISPSLLSSFDKGAHIITLANRMGFDAAVLGNHEFDFGPRPLAARIKESNFPWLSANITNKGEIGFPGAKRKIVKEIGGYKIGIIGLTTVNTPVASSPGPTLGFEDTIAIATAMATEMKAEGVDLIIALSHQDFSEDRDMLRAVPDIDVVLGGHDHWAVALFDGRQVVLKAGSQGSLIGRLKLFIDRKESAGGDGQGRVVWTPDISLISTRDVAPDPATATEVSGLLAKLDAELDKPVGPAGVDIDTQRVSVRGRETVFGNIVADAMRKATESDIAVTNGGGIRGDTSYPRGTELTRRTILTELPFGNRTLKLRVTGTMIQEMLENAVSDVENGAGRFLQISGFKFTYDPTAPSGQRVRDVTVAGKALVPGASYTLATNEFLARGGDGYAMLAEVPRIIDLASARLTVNQVIDAIEAAGTATGSVEGRIKTVE